MTNENYITILGWMVNELKLSGNELTLYALIYGFSQDDESEFSGSLTYIQKALNISRPTATKNLDSLLKKNFIIKIQNIINKVKFNKYKYNKEIFIGSKENLLVSKETSKIGSKVSLPNITNTNTSNLNIQAQNENFAPTDEKKEINLDKEIRKLLNRVFVLFDKNIQNRVVKSKPQIEKWLDVIEKLNRIDGYSLEKIEEVIIWGRGDEKFWKKNFLSIAKLRDNDGGALKFEKLKAAMIHDKSKSKNGHKRTNTKPKRSNLKTQV